MTDVRDVIDDYIIVIDRCREEELGRVCKAFNIKLKTPSRYVALLQLHDWCQHLPTDLQKNLIVAVKAAGQSRYEDESHVSCCAITCVLDARLFGETDIIDNDIIADEHASSSGNYVATEWIEEITIQELFEYYIKIPQDAIEYVYHLAEQLRKLYADSPHLRPIIAIEKIWRKADFKSGVTDIVLSDWGFAAVLDKAERSDAQEREDVQRLARLLIQLLVGRRLQTAKQLPKEKNQLSTDLDEVRVMYPDTMNAPIWTIITNALHTTTQVQELAKQLENFAVLAEPLKDAQPEASTQSTGFPASGQTTPPTPPQPTVTDPVVAIEPPARHDYLEISNPREPDELARQLLLISSQDEDEDKGSEKYSEIFAVGQGSIVDQRGNPIDTTRHKPIQFFTGQRRLYLQRHEINNSSGNYHYYTLADFGYTGDRGQTSVDGSKLSPLFTVLVVPDVLNERGAIVTAGSTIEVATRDPRTQYRLTLKSTDTVKIGGWAAAKINKVVALAVESQRYSIATGLQTLEIPVHVTNPTAEVDQLTIVADGLPPDWPLPQPIQVSLFDQESAKVTLVFVLPVLRFQGTQEVIVRLISDNVSAQVAAVSLQLEVPPHFDFIGFLLPESLRVGAIGDLEIQNNGNLQQDFFISLRDKANELLFEPPEMMVTIQARQTGLVSYRTHARQWRLLGGEKTHDVIALVAPQNGGVAQTINGQIRSRAIIPVWAPILALLLLMGIFLLFSFLFVPVLAQSSVSAGDQMVDVPAAGQDITLEWTALNTCFYSVYQNDRALVWRHWQSATNGSYTIPAANSGDTLEVRLHSCTLLNTKSWGPVTVLPAPTPTALPGPLPQVKKFVLYLENVDIPRINEQGEFTTEPVPQPTVPQLLVGQVGEICFEWEVANKTSDDGYTIQLVPLPDGFDGSALTEATGKECLSIADTYKKPERQTYTFNIMDAAKTPVSAIQGAVQVYAPICTVNTGTTLLIREGPGRNYPVRGELRADSRLIPLGRPVFLAEGTEPDQWVQITLPSDPRPVWVAHSYLYCPVDIAVLPPIDTIPGTPTPLPTATPEPTATPTPDVQPEISIEPEVISLGGCAIFKWKIQNVRSVYLNEEGVVGEAEKTICPTEFGQLKYTWKIENLDGTIVPIERTLIVNPTGPVPSEPTPPE